MTDDTPFEMFEQDAEAQQQEPLDATRVEEEIAAALALEEGIKEAEDLIKDLKKRLKQIMEVSLPSFMAELSLTEFGTADGSRIKLGPSGYGSLNSAPDQDAAVEYLEANGLEGGVLTEVSVKFTEDEKTEALLTAEQLFAYTHKAVGVKRSINPQTLKAFVIRRMEADPEFDPAMVGMTIYTAAKFSKRGKRQ